MARVLARLVGCGAIGVGFILLLGVLQELSAGALAAEHLGESPRAWRRDLAALALELPVPFHVMSVGLVIQKRWLTRRWARVAWYAALVSGCWLGAALAVRTFVL